MNVKKILVVGGAGFIGSQVNKQLHQAGYETVVFDNLSRGDTRAVVTGTFVQGDMANKQDLDALFSQHHFDGVMHFAAFTDVGESVSNPDLYYVNNVATTLNLLHCMLKYDVKVLIFSSSAAVYGIPKDSSHIEEGALCQPINPYGRTKLMVEQILQDFEKAYNLRYCALRYFNAAGGDPSGEIKNFKKQENNLIPLALRSLINESEITVFGDDYDTFDGTCIRDYIHVYDLATAHILALETLLNNGPSGVYNLGNGSGFSVKEVLHAVEKVTGKTLKVVQGDRRPGDPAVLVANAEKAKQSLAWFPHYQLLEEMIDHAWKALKKEKVQCPR